MEQKEATIATDAPRQLTEEQRELVASNLGLAGAAAKRFLRHPGDFDDLVGDACIGLCRAAMSFDESRGEFPAHGFPGATKQLCERIRRQTTAKRAGDSRVTRMTTEALAEMVASPEHDPFADEDRIARSKAVRRAVARLRPRHREVIEAQLRGESLATIAEANGVSREAVRAVAERAREHLRFLLSGRGLI